MKKNLKSKTEVGTVGTLAIGPSNGSHQVVVVDSTTTNVRIALGIAVDRALELEKDIVTACKAIIAANAEGTGMSLVQALAIATTQSQSDNEMAYAISFICQAFVEGSYDNLLSLENASIASGIPVDKDTKNEQAGEGMANDDDGFSAFLKQLMGNEELANADGLGEAEDDDKN